MFQFFILFFVIIDIEMEFNHIAYNSWEFLGSSDFPTLASEKLRLQVLSVIPGTFLIFYTILFVVVAIAALENELRSGREDVPHGLLI